MSDHDLELGTMERRTFLKMLGVSGVVSLAACERLPVRHVLPYLVAPDQLTPGVPARYASTCLACPAACGLLVTVRDGRPTKLEGDPAHPYSRGGLCALGQGHLRGLYDAGRLRAPRVGGADATWAALDTRVRAGLAAARSAGQQVHLVSEPVTSPAARRAIGQFLGPLAGVWSEWGGAVDGGRSATWRAYALLDGRGAIPLPNFERADRLLVLGADFLGAGRDPVGQTASYTARRRLASDFRHTQIEGNLTLTGASADARLRATASERRLLAATLVRGAATGTTATDDLARQLTGALPDLGPLSRRVSELGQDLRDHAGRTLVLSGSDDVVEQAAVALLNRLLGSEGTTLELDRTTPAGVSGLAPFIDGLGAGTVGVAIFLGTNPIEMAAAGDAIAAGLGKVPTTIAISDRPTATAVACGIVAAAHHPLECWGDAAPRPGVRTLAQPTIRPLFDTRHPLENLLIWADSATTDYHAWLRSTWMETVVGSTGTVAVAAWNEALARGGGSIAVSDDPGLAGTVLAADSAALGRLFAGIAAATTDGLEIDLTTEVGVRDGRGTFNPWLRELPEPLTRTSWVATARIAPELAEARGLTDGDIIDLVAAGATLQLPVRILTGQHPRVIGVPIGYGLMDGDGGVKERNAYRIVGVGGSAGIAATLTATGRHESLPLIQVHSLTEGRPIVYQVPSTDARVPHPHHGEIQSLWKSRTYSPRWEMVIDLDACTGCSACVVACQAENNIPSVGPEEMVNQRDMYWLRIDRYFAGDGDQPDVLFEPMLCAQCGNAPCETVCPAAATVHSTDGLSQQIYNRCVGTRYCANNCPTKVRRFNWFDNASSDPVERLVLNPDVVVRDRGVMEKCSFCVQRIQLARIEGKARGDDSVPTVQTACQQSCPAGAIRFGDGSEVDGEIAMLKHQPRAFQVLAELGIDPSITYLARVRHRDGVGDHGEHS